MPFPLTFAERTFDAPPDLAGAALDDIENGGGTVVSGENPSDWIATLAARGPEERRVAVALCAAFLQSRRPGAVAEGSRLALALQHADLGALLPFALDGHDLGLLLHADPLNPEQSVEESLLRAWAGLANLSDAEDRARLLARLRHASLPQLEMTVLASHGSAAEIRRWLPAVLSDGAPDQAIEIFCDGLTRSEPEAEALASALAHLPRRVREQLWLAADGQVKLCARDAVRAHLRPGAG